MFMVFLLLRGSPIINSNYKEADSVFLNLFQELEKSIVAQNLQIKQLR